MGSNYNKGPAASDSIDGLKFGQKIYFEDLGIGVSTKSGNGSRKAQNGLPPRCQVEGCNVDLSDAKGYYSRHKVCGMHSKSREVVVNGLQQRFCQQCSRFHLLPEFDSDKRSCRRRLAGHNERRRKPPPGSLLSSRLGRVSSSLFGNESNTRNGFLLDFSLYSKNSGRDIWPGSKTSQVVSGSQSTSLGKFHPNPWPGNSQEAHKMYPQGSTGETSFRIPSGEYTTGVSSDATCALSLLSNQTWSSSQNGSSSTTELGNLVNLGGGAPVPTHSATVAHVPVNNNNSSSWNFKGSENEHDMGLHGTQSDHLGLGQFSHGLDSQLHGDLFMDQAHGGRPYMEPDHSISYSSAAAGQVHWSL